MLRLGHVVALCVLALLCLGTVMVHSADMRVAPLGVDGYAQGGITLESILFSRTMAYTAASLVLMMVASHLPIRRLAGLFAGESGAGESGRPMLRGRGGDGQAWEHPLKGLAAWGVIVAILLGVLISVYTPGLGRTVNGSSRWVGFGSFSFQPSEIVKWALVAGVAWYAVVRQGFLDKLGAGLAPVLIGVGLLVGLVAMEDLGTGVLMGIVAGAILIAGGAKLWHLCLFVPPALMAVLLLIVTSGYRARRILAFLDPFAYPETHGYHMIQSMIAIANGQGAGRGLGNGLQKFGYLPEDRTDFLFAVICEELGLLGAVMVVGLYAALLLSAVRILSREPTQLLKLFGVGVMATVGVQALINMLVVTGLGPTKGIALPLLSAGGTGWMLTAACLGVLIAMDREQAADEPLAADLDEADDDDEEEDRGWSGASRRKPALAKA